jgi:hypothetical protein
MEPKKLLNREGIGPFLDVSNCLPAYILATLYGIHGARDSVSLIHLYLHSLAHKELRNP